MAVQLSDQNLSDFGLAQKPAYSRSDVSPGIVHLGLGGFHRAHQAVYTEDVLAGGDHRWGIVGASLRSATMRNQLAPQDFLYTLCTKHSDHTMYRVIGAVCDVLTLSQHQRRLIDLIASPLIKIVTLTITEKGYCLTPDGELDQQHPDIQHDLNHRDVPISAPGLLATALKLRQENGAGAMTVISCDNLSGNGHCTREAVMGMSTPDQHSWINDNVCFPDTMVDRIVPATIDADRQSFTQATAIDDRGLVISEPFSQWVIENNFASDRPEWERAGAQIVDNVAAYEQIKLRLLNTTHSALAYLGMLAGYEFIHEAMADPVLARFSAYLLDEEISPTIQLPADFDIEYKQSILERFANTAIHYRTTQVANDGSLKLQQRIYPTVTKHLQRQSQSPGLVLVVAAWLHCLHTPQYTRQFNDPAADTIRTCAADDLVQMLSTESKLFGAIWQDDEFRRQVQQSLTELQQSNIQSLLQKISGS